MGKRARENPDLLVEKVVGAKEAGGKVVVVTGSGPNIHEGVTTLIAELIHKHVVDGVITSSAVVAHEMAGSLDQVKRVNGTRLPVSRATLPRGEIFEVTVMTRETLEMIRHEMEIDLDLIKAALAMEGQTIIKAAGNMGYPVGLRTERISALVEDLALREGLSFEAVAGLGADPMTMIGAGARLGIPVLVSVPQLIGGGAVGLSIAGSMPIRRRSDLIAQALSSADVIIESGIALSQEIHDGPFETYTGHAIWSARDGIPTYSLAGLRERRLSRARGTVEARG